MTDQETIQPCPFCGKINGQDEMGETYRWRRWRCNECGATGPEVRCSITGSGQGGVKEARELALHDWNTRPPTHGCEAAAHIPTDALDMMKPPLLMLRGVTLYGYAGEGTTPVYKHRGSRPLTEDQKYKLACGRFSTPQSVRLGMALIDDAEAYRANPAAPPAGSQSG